MPEIFQKWYDKDPLQSKQVENIPLYKKEGEEKIRRSFPLYIFVEGKHWINTYLGVQYS